MASRAAVPVLGERIRPDAEVQRTRVTSFMAGIEKENLGIEQENQEVLKLYIPQRSSTNVFHSC